MAHIKTYARIKPSSRRYDEFEAAATKLYIRVPDVLRDASGQVRTRMCSMNHEFKFTHVFPETALQEEVFDGVARDIIGGFLNGYNGTIFAYGQTGSGKTYTVEGSARRYGDRGLAPRALSMIYKELESQTDLDATIHVSYMEIYQEVGYDLLNQAARSSSVVTPFPKVAVVEGTKGTCLIRNLSSHLAANEDVAQSLLLQGQANRKVAETPMNQRSSRSHAVFTITLAAKKQNAEIIMRSKLHMVDLAGSERVSKTGIGGQQLAEAKYINLSLHHLEGVIIALHQEATGERPHTAVAMTYSSFYKRVLAERTHPYKRPRRAMGSTANLGLGQRKPNSSSSSASIRPSSADGYRSLVTSTKHVPYRNSLLTMVLRDSLGGNCQTAMIATISMEEDNLSESLSTCRFSQRVACITNTVRKNEEIDDKLMIKRLRKRIAELESELARQQAAQGDNGVNLSVMDSKLTDADKLDCARIIQSYVGGRINDPIVAGITSPLRFKECMKIFKTMVMKHYGQSEGKGSFTATPLTAWAEAEEPRPSTVPSNLKLQAGSKHETIPSATSKPVSSSATELSKPNSKIRSSDQLFRSATDVSSRMPAIAQDIDHYMSELSLDQRESLSRDSSFRSSTSQSRRHTDGQSRSRRTSRESYKSPFDRKREKAIKMLTYQVQKRRDEQKEEKHHLEQFQVSIQEEQLTVVINELRMKCEQTKRQLADQQALVKRIKAEGKNEDLYNQEKTVERQLRKRQNKVEHRIQLVQDQIRLWGKHQETQDKTAKEDDDQKSKVTQPKPGVTSRMVLDTLQEEDRNQQKARVKIEQQRVIALTQHVEVKEAATRQKLREFKMKLRQNHLESSTDSGDPGSLNTTAASRDMVDTGDENTSAVVNLDSASKPDRTTFTMKMNVKDLMEKPSSGSQKHSPFVKVQNYESLSFDRKENKKHLDNLWMKSYSSSSQNPAVARFPSNDPFSQNALKTDPFTGSANLKLENSPIKEAGYEDLPDVLRNINDDPLGNDSFQSEVPIIGSRPMFKGPAWSRGEGSEGRNRINGSVLRQVNATDYEDTKQKHNNRHGPKQNKSEVFMPSEYVNQNPGMAFDARKMGLTNKTFESALNSMLGMEEKPGPITLSHSQYDEYARSTQHSSSTTAKSTAKVNVQVKSPEKGQKNAGPATAKRMTNPLHKPSSNDWGPESKNISISDRLSRYLKMNTLPSSPIKPGQGHSFEDTDIDPYRTPKVVDDTAPPGEWHKKLPPNREVPNIDIDDYTPKIKAVPEKKREVTYMSTVKEQKDRVSRIRRARRAAEVIQKAWRNYNMQR